jgi:hypothetical protein
MHGIGCSTDLLCLLKTSGLFLFIPVSPVPKQPKPTTEEIDPITVEAQTVTPNEGNIIYGAGKIAFDELNITA